MNGRSVAGDRVRHRRVSSESSRPLFTLSVSRESQPELIEELLTPTPSGEGPRLLATVNLDHVVNLRKNAEFRRAYGWAWRVTIDGAPVYAYAKAVGAAPPSRITGADLFSELMTRWEPARHRLFFILSSSEAASSMAETLAARGFKPDDLAFEVPPFGFDKDEAISRRLAQAINHFQPSHLVIALGSPKSEVWTYRQRHLLGDMKVLCVGAAVEFAVGLKKRAPRWMQSTGLEWLFRFFTEPKRLFRRYFIDSLGFFKAVATDLRSRGERVC